MADKNCCKTCVYYRVSEEYWHDHYLIPERPYCIYKSLREKVDPNGCCENYQSENN